MKKTLISNEEQKLRFAELFGVSVEKVEEIHEWVNRCFTLELGRGFDLKENWMYRLRWNEPTDYYPEVCYLCSFSKVPWGHRDFKDEFPTKKEAAEVANAGKDKFLISHREALEYGMPRNALLLLEPVGGDD